MPTSARGSEPARGRLGGAFRARRGFTLIEMLVVMAIVAIAAGLVIVSLPDRQQDRLNEDAERLAALLEAARAEARASGIAVQWAPATPGATDGADFRFSGLPPSLRLPTQWLSSGVNAEIIAARAVILGPEPVLPPQRIVLHLDARRAELVTDGLAPFAAPAASPSP